MDIHQHVQEWLAAEFRLRYPEETTDIEPLLMEIRNAFEAADEAHKGDLDVHGVQMALETLGHGGLDMQTVKERMSQIDDDNTGSLRFIELVNMVMLENGLLATPMLMTDEPVAMGGRIITPEFKRRSAFAINRGLKKAYKNRMGALKRLKRGHIHVACRMDMGADIMVLTCRVVEAAHLLAKDRTGKADAYVKLQVVPADFLDSKTKKKTAVLKKSSCPVFNENFTWTLRKDIDLAQYRLTIGVWDHQGGLTRNYFVGGMSFSLTEILDEDEITEGWFVLMDEERSLCQSFRSMHIETPKELKVLPVAGSMKNRKSKQPIPHSAESFAYVKDLGCGSFGKVVLAHEKKSKNFFAIKILPKKDVMDTDHVEGVLTERRLLSLSQGSPFITNIFSAFQNDTDLFLVMEFVEGGDLMSLLAEHHKLPEPQAVFFVVEMLCGLWYLHDMNCIYRDLKLENVLLTKEGHVKLIDFGLAKDSMDKDSRAHTLCGTPHFLAPEIISYSPYYYPVDHWSLGVLCYVLLTGFLPFKGETEALLFEAILSQELAFDPKMSMASQKFLQEILHRNMEKRLGSGPAGRSRIMTHDFFKGINWERAKVGRLRPPLTPRKFKYPKGAAMGEFSSIPGGPNIEEDDEGLFANFDFVADSEAK